MLLKRLLHRWLASNRLARRLATSVRTLARGGSRLHVDVVAKGSVPFLKFAPPGHFYSPLPNLDEVQPDEVRRGPDAYIAGIDLDIERQMALLSDLAERYSDFPFLAEKPPENSRFHLGNGHFESADAIVLHMLLRHLKPLRIVEVGSGYSSALMLDVAEQFLDNQVAMTFIDPFPQRLLSRLTPADRERITICEDRVQDVDQEVFSALGPGDILFVDSSHVVRVGSDVNHLCFEVLPRLPKGVFVHIHDIFWPFDYPDRWLHEGRAWTEAYLVRAFLMYNHDFQVRLYNSQLGALHREQIETVLPAFMDNTGGSIWLERV